MIFPGIYQVNISARRAFRIRIIQLLLLSYVCRILAIRMLSFSKCHRILILHPKKILNILICNSEWQYYIIFLV